LNIILVNNELPPQRITEQTELKHGLYAIAREFIDVGKVYILTEDLCNSFSNKDDIIISTKFMENANAFISCDNIRFILTSHNFKPQALEDSDLELQAKVEPYKRSELIFTQFSEDIEIIKTLGGNAHYIMLPLKCASEFEPRVDSSICFCNYTDKIWPAMFAMSIDATPHYYNTVEDAVFNLNNYHAAHNITNMLKSFCVLDLGLRNNLGIMSYLSTVANVPCIAFSSSMQNRFYPELVINNLEDFMVIYEKLHEEDYYNETVKYAQSKLNFDLSIVKELVLDG